MMTIAEKVEILEKFFDVEKPEDLTFEDWIDTLENMEEGYKKKHGVPILQR